MEKDRIDLRTGTVSVNPATGDMIKRYTIEAPEAVKETLAANAMVARRRREPAMLERVQPARQSPPRRRRSHNFRMVPGSLSPQSSRRQGEVAAGADQAYARTGYIAGVPCDGRNVE